MWGMIGNRSHPNIFSNQLLDNLAELQGEKPYIRVGGNTQYVLPIYYDLGTSCDDGGDGGEGGREGIGLI